MPTCRASRNAPLVRAFRRGARARNRSSPRAWRILRAQAYRASLLFACSLLLRAALLLFSTPLIIFTLLRDLSTRHSLVPCGGASFAVPSSSYCRLSPAIASLRFRRINASCRAPRLCALSLMALSLAGTRERSVRTGMIGGTFCLSSRSALLGIPHLCFCVVSG